MGVSLLRTLDAACLQRLLELDEAVLIDVHRALVKEKDLLSGIKKEEDPHNLERKLSAILRSLSGRDEKSWFESNQPTGSAVLWLILCSEMARLSELDAMTKPSASLITVTNDIFRCLAQMYSLTAGDQADSLDVYGFVKALAIFAASSIPLREKAHALRAFELLQLQVDDILATSTPTNATAKAKSCAIDVCCAWISKVTLLSGVQGVRTVLARCANTPAWHRVYIDLVSANPLVAALLVDEVDSICASRNEDVIYKRFALDNLITGLRACDQLGKTSIERLICIALRDQDSSLRVLAWKTLAMTYSKMGQDEQDYVRNVACDALLIEDARSVGAAILKLIAMDLKPPRQVTSSSDRADAKTKRLQEFLLYSMAGNNGQFPSSWTHDSICFLARGHGRLPAELVMANFIAGTKDGKRMIATLYKHHLLYLGEVEARSELEGLARHVQVDTIVAFENFVGSVFETSGSDQKTAKSSNRDDDRILSACRLTATHFGEVCEVTRQDLRTSILLELAVSQAASFAQPHVESLWRASTQLFQAIEGVLASTGDDGFSVLEALIALRGLRLVVESDTNSTYHTAVDHSLESTSATLVAHSALQRETVRLIYALAKPQVKAYYCLALTQEEAFTDKMMLASFLTLVGVVAYENAQYLARQQVHRKRLAQFNDNEDEDELRRESVDYMEQFKDSVAMKSRIKSIKDASVSDGLLSAYLPLVERAIESSHTNKVKAAAVWTLGEFMKISPAITEAYFGKLLSMVTNCVDNPPVCVACIDVWFVLQPVMKPSRTKEGVDIMYKLINAADKHEAVAQHALKCLHSLVLDAQLRDDQLHHFSVFLASSKTNMFAMTQRFFRSYFHKHPAARVSSTVFEIYFALASQPGTQTIAVKVAASLMELAADASCLLESLEIALADELDTATRSTDALRLLGQFNSISASTVQKLIESIDRVRLHFSKSDSRGLLEQILLNQLQRSKDKSERVGLKDAISKLKGTDASEQKCPPRRVPLNVVSMGRHVDTLKHK